MATITASPSSKNKNIPIQDLIEYANQDLGPTEIAKLVGCHHSNVIRRLERIGYNRKSLEAYRKNRADYFMLTGQKIHERLTTANVKVENAKDMRPHMGIEGRKAA